MNLYLERISKSYEEKNVLNHYSLELKEGGVYCLMGPSGIGKTTLLRIILGLEQADQGTIIWSDPSTGKVQHPGQISVVFQENRLLDFTTAIKNIQFVEGKEGLLFKAEEVLEHLLEKGDWNRPVRELSGGMQRRVAIGRALAASSDLLLMDEPFTGLDEGTKERVIETILNYRNGRTLLVITHQEEDAALLKAEIIELSA